MLQRDIEALSGRKCIEISDKLCRAESPQNTTPIWMEVTSFQNRRPAINIPTSAKTA